MRPGGKLDWRKPQRLRFLTNATRDIIVTRVGYRLLFHALFFFLVKTNAPTLPTMQLCSAPQGSLRDSGVFCGLVERMTDSTKLIKTQKLIMCNEESLRSFVVMNVFQLLSEHDSANEILTFESGRAQLQPIAKFPALSSHDPLPAPCGRLINQLVGRARTEGHTQLPQGGGGFDLAMGYQQSWTCSETRGGTFDSEPEAGCRGCWQTQSTRNCTKSAFCFQGMQKKK